MSASEFVYVRVVKPAKQRLVSRKGWGPGPGWFESHGLPLRGRSSQQNVKARRRPAGNKFIPVFKEKKRRNASKTYLTHYNVLVLLNFILVFLELYIKHLFLY